MEKNKIESEFRKYVKENLSPTMEDIQFVAKIYKSFTDVLAASNCLQIGSFPRYTAVKPLHDLDVLYRIGEWNEVNKNPKTILEGLANKFRVSYKNPTQYRMTMMVQTHSISFKYMDGDDDVFAVDIVPAMKRGTNEFGDDTFYVPEILKFRSKPKRQKFYEEVRMKGGNVKWIKTDPLGYISVASLVNLQNEDFRKSAKFIKGWKNSCKQIDDEFKLKSFHLEQLATIEFQKDINLTIHDAIYNVISNLKQSIKRASIPDRADFSKCIDHYVEELSKNQIKLVEQAVDSFMINLENFDGDVEQLINSGFGNDEEREGELRRISESILGGSAYAGKSGIISNNSTSGVKHKPHTNFGG